MKADPDYSRAERKNVRLSSMPKKAARRKRKPAWEHPTSQSGVVKVTVAPCRVLSGVRTCKPPDHIPDVGISPCERNSPLPSGCKLIDSGPLLVISSKNVERVRETPTTLVACLPSLSRTRTVKTVGPE